MPNLRVLYSLLGAVLAILPVQSQYVTIPDTSFLYALIDEGVDTDGDSLISNGEAASITSLDLSRWEISSMIGVETFINLDSLYCQDNRIEILDLSTLDSLRYLDCQSNRLTSLALYGNTQLEYLNCDFNQLTQLDITHCPLLKVIYCSYNDLRSLDLSNNALLITLFGNNNMLTWLDLSHNPGLRFLDASGNRLISLDLTFNMNLTRLMIGDMPSLHEVCIAVNPINPNPYIQSYGSPNVYFPMDCNYTEHLFFLDSAFYQAVLDHGTDINGDSLISFAEAEAVRSLDISNRGIYNLDCIGFFRNLDSLECAYNNLTSLELSGNQSLKYLNCSDCNLYDLDLTWNDQLAYLDVSDNSLRFLDISNNVGLAYLDCRNNRLGQLDLLENIQLTDLVCDNNWLTELDLSPLSLLTNLECGGNRFTRLDLEYNSLLTNIVLGQMPELREVLVWTLPFPPSGVAVDTSGCANLYFTTEFLFLNTIVFPDPAFLNALIDQGADINGDSLIFYDEARVITNLNVSDKAISDLTCLEHFANLDSLDCSGNPLSRIDLSYNLNLKWIDLSGMDSLRQLCVWQLPFPTGQVEVVDTGSPLVVYDTLCGSNRVHIPDPNFLQALLNDGVDVNMDSCISYKEAQTRAILNMSESGIYTLKGIEEFIQLQRLYCSDNYLDSIDLSSNQFLLELDCGVNRLTILDISRNPRLEDLSCGDNLLTTLDLTNNHKLSHLDCGMNQLDSLDLSHNKQLRVLDCSNNLLASLDLSSLENLEDIYCSENQLVQLNLSGNTQLKYLNCSNNYLINLDLTPFGLIRDLVGSENLFTSLDLRSNPGLQYVELVNMPFLSRVCVTWDQLNSHDLHFYTDGSPLLDLSADCPLNWDYLEENDTFTEAASIDPGFDLKNLAVSSGDDDWYYIKNTDQFFPLEIRIECVFDISGGELRFDLTDADQIVLASSKAEQGKASVDFYPLPQTAYYLHVFLYSGTHNQYALQWEAIGHHSNNVLLNVSIPESPGVSYTFHPLKNESAFAFDTVKVNLMAGDSHSTKLTFHNEGPDPYYFYSSLAFTGGCDSLNRAVRLDGLEGHIRVERNSSLDLAGDLTIEAWVQIEEGCPLPAPIVSKGMNGKGYMLGVTESDDGPVFEFEISPGNIFSNSVIFYDTWVHVAVTYDGTELCMYFSGLLDSKKYITGPGSVANQDLFIGTIDERHDPRQYFKGSIDDIRIWNRDRTPSEIHSFLHVELQGTESGLVGYWPLNGANSRVVYNKVTGQSSLIYGDFSWINTFVPITTFIGWSPFISVIPAGRNHEYLIEFNAANIQGGHYFSDIQLISNDHDSPDIIIPTVLQVTDAPSFSTQPDSVLFGEIDIYRTHTRQLEVQNYGTETLYIDSISAHLPGIRITPASATLHPGEQQSFMVEAFIRYIDHFFDSLTFYTNDPSDQVVHLPVSGEGNSIQTFALLPEIADTVSRGYFKTHYKRFPNMSSTHTMYLEPSIVTCSLPVESNDRIPRPDTPAAEWISTSLPDSSEILPDGEITFGLRLDASDLNNGDYMADFILEWHNPDYHKGFIPIRMHVKNPVSARAPHSNHGDVVLYPNPTRGVIYIQTQNDGMIDIVVTAANGQVVQNSRFSGISCRLDLSEYPKGIYFITIRSNNSVTTRKIIKI